MMQITMQKNVRSVINFIEKTQVTDLFSVSQATNLTLTQPFRTANNTIRQTQMRLSRQHSYGGTILQARQNICTETALEHTWTTK